MNHELLAIVQCQDCWCVMWVLSKRGSITAGANLDCHLHLPSSQPFFSPCNARIIRSVFPLHFSSPTLFPQADVAVNWCPALGTVLANEEVVDGVSERGGHPVIRKVRC